MVSMKGTLLPLQYNSRPNQGAGSEILPYNSYNAQFNVVLT